VNAISRIFFFSKKSSLSLKFSSVLSGLSQLNLIQLIVIQRSILLLYFNTDLFALVRLKKYLNLLLTHTRAPRPVDAHRSPHITHLFGSTSSATHHCGSVPPFPTVFSTSPTCSNLQHLLLTTAAASPRSPPFSLRYPLI
jgi:hypothetical protein